MTPQAFIELACIRLIADRPEELTDEGLVDAIADVARQEQRMWNAISILQEERGRCQAWLDHAKAVLLRRCDISAAAKPSAPA